MRNWRSKLILPPDYQRQEEESRGNQGALWPDCVVCSRREGMAVNVTAYGIKDCGKLPGKKGMYYTDVYARCHGEEDVIRIEDVRWDDMKKMNADDHLAVIAAIKALPFFYPGSEAGRSIPASAMANLRASVRGRA